jgi:predicted flavoprotein YhiN
VFRERFAGEPLKNVALSFGGGGARRRLGRRATAWRAERSTRLAAALRDAIEAEERAVLEIDLRPDIPPRPWSAACTPRGGQSLSSWLRKAVKLSPVEINLLREAHGLDLPAEPAALAAAIKAAPVVLTAVQPLERAISAAGGRAVRRTGRPGAERAPNVFLAGEMLDWEAPTGGYLLQACFATGVAAARAVIERLNR